MKRILSLAVFLSMAIIVNAGISAGYYKVRCTSYDRYMAENYSQKTLTTSSTFAEGEYEKMWKVTTSGSNIIMQNVYTGHYVMTQSSNSQAFPMGSTQTALTVSGSDGSWMLRAGQPLHCAASQGYQVVGWYDTTNPNSLWDFESISIADEEVKTIQAQYQALDDLKANASTYNSKLTTFFTDLSCSTLKSSYQSSTDEALMASMKAAGLPEPLQRMGVSVKNRWDNETDGTYSERFRVHDYKCYSQASYWCNTLNATQFNDMSNPTGIYAHTKDVLTIFVGSDIPSGCSLRIVGSTGIQRQTYNGGMELKKGVNVIQADADNELFYIMYSTSSRTTDVNTYPEIKIHVEGGNVLGYADVAGLDESECNVLYKGILDYANQEIAAKGADAHSLYLMVKGERGMFLFPVDTYNSIWKTTPYRSGYTTNYNIYKSIHWFDSVLAWEWGIMGFTQRVANGETDEHEHVTGGDAIYGKYCNNLALTVQNADGTNPYATWQYTSMPGVGGVESSYNAERADFDNWCVGHESGHDNQGAINLPSSTESSNNLFSNIVCYLTGYRMSRGEPVSTTNADYLSGKQFALRDIGSTHRMYWQLYLYYHEAMHKTDFYPELFKSLRADGLNLNSGQCFLKFYQKACEAAQEDLTEFFRGWGFLFPFENQYFGDYTSYTLTLTQQEIDDAIAAVKAKGYPENRQIMFIEDRTEQPYRWDPWASGTNDPRPDQGYRVGQCGTMGSVESMTLGTATSAGSFLYRLTNNTLTLTGTPGGAGVAVYNNDGQLLAFGNDMSITLPEKVLASDIVVKAIATDGKITVVKSVLEEGTDSQKRQALNDLIAIAEEIITRSENQIVGYYRSNCLDNLKEALSGAKAAVSSAVRSQYGEKAESLQREMDALKISGTVYPLVTGNVYRIFNKAYTDYYVNANNYSLTSTTTVSSSADQRWVLEDAGNGKFHVKNLGTGKYINVMSRSALAKASTTNAEEAYAIAFEAQAGKAWALNTGAGDAQYIHMDGSRRIVGWYNDQDASRWYIQLVGEGDVNGDGSVSIADVTFLIQLMKNNPAPAACYDVNGDGRVDSADVNLLGEIVAGQVQSSR